jgi:hypothetical protein
MVKKIGILGFILVVVAAAGMVWAETYTGSIPAPQPMVAPAAAPACVGPNCAPPPPPPKVKAAPAKLRTSIQVKMSYPEPTPPPMMYCGPACAPPPIPVAVPMWRFIVPWPPFVYYLPVD